MMVSGKFGGYINVMMMPGDFGGYNDILMMLDEFRGYNDFMMMFGESGGHYDVMMMPGESGGYNNAMMMPGKSRRYNDFMMIPSESRGYNDVIMMPGESGGYDDVTMMPGGCSQYVYRTLESESNPRGTIFESVNEFYTKTEFETKTMGVASHSFLDATELARVVNTALNSTWKTYSSRGSAWKGWGLADFLFIFRSSWEAYFVNGRKKSVGLD
ncbi:hypothetical protein BC332_15599 [Capsicum chinense]|nr:hypothetical protein BC332_15599 [Capsicum chinense]